MLEKRREIELRMIWQRIQQKEQMLRGHEEIIKLRKWEVELDEMRNRVALTMRDLERMGPPREEVDSIDKTRNWLQDTEVGSKPSSVAGATKKGKVVSPTSSEKCIKELEGQVAQLKRQVTDSRPPGLGDRTGLQQLDRLGLMPTVPTQAREWQSPCKEFPNRQEREAI